MMKRFFTKSMLLKVLFQAGILLAILAIYVYATVRYPLEPAMEQTQAFERHYHAIGTFPFVTSYFLFTPKDYDASRKYPLALALHGASKRCEGASAASGDDVQQICECFVLMPMAPAYQGWATREGGVEALAIAMDMLDGVRRNYSIDENRIYVTGHSMGGIGTFAALAHYPETFAAGVAVNGYWFPTDVAKFRDQKLWVFHGDEDRIFPIASTSELMLQIETEGGNPKYTVMNGVGHNSWPAYKDLDVWRWLTSQRRDP
jgi:predicted peptidase